MPQRAEEFSRAHALRRIPRARVRVRCAFAREKPYLPVLDLPFRRATRRRVEASVYDLRILSRDERTCHTLRVLTWLRDAYFRQVISRYIGYKLDVVIALTEEYIQECGEPQNI